MPRAIQGAADIDRGREILAGERPEAVIAEHLAPLGIPYDADVVAANRHFTEIARKDLQAAAATADAVGVAHPVTDLAAELAPRWFLLPED